MAESEFDFNQGKQHFLEVSKKEQRSLQSRIIRWFLALMVATAAVVAIAVFVFGVSPTGPGLGERLVINNGSVYYKGGASRADAEALGKFLNSARFFNGRPDVFIRKEGGGFVVGIVVVDGFIDEPENLELVDQLRQPMSEQAFGGKPVVIELIGTKYQLHGEVQVLRTLK